MRSLEPEVEEVERLVTALSELAFERCLRLRLGWASHSSGRP